MITLVRVAQRMNRVWGVLVSLDGTPIAVTLERAFSAKDPAHPAIVHMSNLRPKFGPGIYRCSKTHFERGGYDTYEIHMDGHTRILFHIGNTVKDTEGCVLVGTSFSLEGIHDSRSAFYSFMNKINSVSEFDLEVK